MGSSRRRRFGAAVVLAAFVAVASAAWVLGGRVQSPSQAAARAAAPTPSWVTAPVEHRVLASTLITRGDVAPETSAAVGGPVSAATGDGFGVVTGLFVARGDEVTVGERIVEVGGRPVFVFAGATPAFRALRPGMTGSDVAQLQAGLVAGGCDAGTTTVYDDATKACVERLYGDAGYDTVRGSTSEVADLAAAEAAVQSAGDDLASAENELAAAGEPADAGEVADAETAAGAAQRAYDAAARAEPTAVSTATATLDAALASLNAVLAGAAPATAPADAANAEDTGGGATAAGVAARDRAWTAVQDAAAGIARAQGDADDDVAGADDALRTAQNALAAVQAPADTRTQQLAVDQRGRAVTRAEDDLAALQAVSGAVVPYGEVVFVPELPARVDRVDAVVGSPASAGADAGASRAALVMLASMSLHAELTVPQAALDLVHDGDPVELLDEASGATVTGSVASISDHLDTSANGGAAGYPAVVDADLPDAWSGRNVRATFTTASTDHAVLVVPAAAVSSGADGRTRVQVERTDGTVDTVGVTTGLSADGYVEVAADADTALAEGDRVVIGR